MEHFLLKSEDAERQTDSISNVPFGEFISFWTLWFRWGEWNLIFGAGLSSCLPWHWGLWTSEYFIDFNKCKVKKPEMDLVAWWMLPQEHRRRGSSHPSDKCRAELLLLNPLHMNYSPVEQNIHQEYMRARIRCMGKMTHKSNSKPVPTKPRQAQCAREVLSHLFLLSRTVSHVCWAPVCLVCCKKEKLF